MFNWLFLPFLLKARHCCIYCLASKETMQKSKEERGLSTKRTLQLIRQHYHSFVEDGSRRNKAKDGSFSIVDTPKLEIEVDHVSKNTRKNFFFSLPPFIFSLVAYFHIIPHIGYSTKSAHFAWCVQKAVRPPRI